YKKQLYLATVNINENHKSHTETYANVISPSIANLTAKLEALELHSLIPGSGSNGKIDNDISQTQTIKSLMSDNDFKSFIKNIVQEVNNEKVSSYIPYKNNRKPIYNNENYYNDKSNYSYQKSYNRNNMSFNNDNDPQVQRYNQSSNPGNSVNNGQPYNNRSYNNYPPRHNYNQPPQHGYVPNQNPQRYNQTNQPQNNYNRNNYQADNHNQKN
ncbi:hypothetical protein INT48_000426, partial [Thamnidium elegans]